MADMKMGIRRPADESDETMRRGSGPAARGEETHRKERRVSRSFSIPEGLAVKLKVASALTGMEQSEILAEAVTPVVQRILEENREFLEI